MSDDKNIDPNKMAETTEGAKALEKQIRNLAKAYSDLDKGIKNLKGGNAEANDSLRESANFAEGLGDKLGGLMGTTSGLNANLSRLASAGVNSSQMFESFTGSITKNFNAMAIGVSVVEKMFEATTALVGATDAAMVSFQRQTGAASTYGTQIMALEKSLYMYGVTMDEAGESTAALVTGIKNFDEMNEDTQRDLMETTAILGEMGIESQITAQSMNFLANSMGLLPEEAASATRSMLVLAKELKTPPQEMAAAFQSAQPRLAAFGANAGAVFQKLAKNAHNATMEVDAMLRISEQFDKFDTAANSVGSLNAALGGPYLSTMRMVTTTDPTDRLKMMSDAARQAGKSFDSMEYYERKMLASAMGLESVNELALVMRGRFDDVVKPVKLTTDEIIKQEDALKSYNSITEEFNQLWRTFAVDIAGPVISFVKSMLQAFQELGSTSIPFLVGGILLIGAALAPFTSGLTAVVAGVTGLIVLLKGLYDLISNSQPMLDIFSKVWEIMSPRIEKLKSSFASLFKSTGDVQSSFDKLVVDYAPYIGAFFVAFADAVLSIAENVMMLAEAYKNSGVFTGLAYLAGGIVTALGVLALGILKIVQAFIYLNKVLNPIYHFFYVGNSPSFIEVLGMVGDAFTAIGDAIKYPIQMFAKMLSGLKDVAGVLAGKALEFIGGAISYVFGGSSAPTPETEVNNGGFNRKEDMESMVVSIGDEVAKAVKEALEGVQMNNKIQLEVSA